MCKCITEVKEALKAEDNANYVEMDCSTITNFRAPAGQLDPYKTGQRVTINYNHVKRDGGIIKKNRKSFVVHVFCPFCGVKYGS